LKFYLSEKDIAAYHRDKFRKKSIEPELIDFITPYGYATLGELRKSGFECELSNGLKSYKPKDNHWHRVTEHGAEYAEPLDEFAAGKPGYNELQQHEPLDTKIDKYPYLRNICPYELSTVTRMGKERSTMHLREIERVPGADVQYSLLIHYHRIAGTIPMVRRQAPPITIEEEVEAFNLYQSGMSTPEIATKLGRAKSTVWRALLPRKQKPKIQYHRIKGQIARVINEMHDDGVPTKEIAQKLGLRYRSVRYYLFERPKAKGISDKGWPGAGGMPG
jgi:DNA-binding CsgD family transcriptional regulator